MKAMDNVGITFVNHVIGRGVLNGVVNITLGAFNFSPNEEGTKVDPDPVVVARLRMDLECAKHLYESLGSLLQDVEEKTKQQMQAPNGSGEGVAVGKPN